MRQVARLLLARSELELEPHEAQLWDALFHKFLSQRLTRELLAAGTLECAREGDALPHGRGADGENAISLLVDGFASVLVASRHVATLGRADFVGEMSFLDETLPSHAHVVALEPVSYVRWDARALRALCAREREVEHALHAIWTQQLVRRLGRMDERVRLRAHLSSTAADDDDDGRAGDARRGGADGARALLARRETVLGAELELLELRAQAAAAEHAYSELARELAPLDAPPANGVRAAGAAVGGAPAALPGEFARALAVAASESAERLPWYMRACLWYHRWGVEPSGGAVQSE